MLRTFVIKSLLVNGLVLLCFKNTLAQATSTELSTKFQNLTDQTIWQQVATLPLAFPAHHPQGMVKIGSYFYMSSVEVLDRAAGKGTGHLFKFDDKGKLLADLRLGEGAMYHPGGIDFDGKYIWVPVAEYRPNSHSIVYKVDPETLKSTEVFRVDDHVGGLVHDTDSHTLHGISWGSRTFYAWPLESDGKIGGMKSPRVPGTPNPSYYIDYQDCHYVGQHLMLCGGLKNYKNGRSTFGLGGLELINLTDLRPVHQVPLALWSPTGRPMTQNPFWLESTETGLRAYFVPDDNQGTLFIYETKVE
ncbi:DUF6454 family protein [Salmonirosea aquatica]|uniref:Uncharacterized protein n=1 Tax=Salmonirosea aquatica TaxID=2654236 RepID=A0A7C9BKG1_9BACT|nr:hypothetical protein [Cytophagaceae bacterium SJW1-29]